MLTTKNGFSIINKHLAKRRKSYQTAAVTGRSDEFPWTIGGSGFEEKYSRGRRGAPAKGGFKSPLLRFRILRILSEFTTYCVVNSIFLKISTSLLNTKKLLARDLFL